MPTTIGLVLMILLLLLGVVGTVLTAMRNGRRRTERAARRTSHPDAPWDEETAAAQHHRSADRGNWF